MQGWRVHGVVRGLEVTASLQDGAVQNLEVWRVCMKMLYLVAQMKDPGAPLFTVKFPVLKQNVLLHVGGHVEPVPLSAPSN